MGRVLVLGDGGVSGTIWEAGLLAGLANEGFPFAEADRILGTGGGAYLGAQLGLDRHPAFLRESLGAIAEMGRAPEADLNQLARLYMMLPFGGPAPDALLASIGACALATTRVSEADYLAAFDAIDLDAAWPEAFACTAIDAINGELKVFDRQSGASLRAATAAAGAAPGHFPPVHVLERRCMDAAARSATNADLAAGAEKILILAVALPSAADALSRKMGWEYAAIDAAGGATLTIMPDADSAAAFGFDPEDVDDAQGLSEAAFHQGQAAAAGVIRFWSEP